MEQRQPIGRLLLIVLGLAASRAEAFPIWARKYETSCQTCHVAVPKLNNFGLAFRDNGFEWPGGEEDMVRDKPVVLAAEANRESFPKTIWPSWLPHTVPLAILMVNELYVSKKYDKYVSPEGLGTDIEMGLGGAIASGIAARADLTMVLNVATRSADLGIEQAWLDFRLVPKHLDLKIGRIYPEIFTFPIQALGGDLWLNTRTTGASTWTLKGRQGLELRSILARGRLRAVAGIAGSEGDLGNNFDGWGRVSYKIGGMRYDGVDEGQSEPTTSKDPSKPWRDTSLQIGLSAYVGTAKFNADDPMNGMPVPTVLDKFYHLGVNLNLWLGDLNFLAAFIVGHHTHLDTVVDPTLALGPRFMYLAFGQIDYVVYPWLVPTIRFEWADDARYVGYDQDNPRWHLMPGVSALIRANMRAYVFAELGPDKSPDDATVEKTASLSFYKLTVGLFTAF